MLECLPCALLHTWLVVMGRFYRALEYVNPWKYWAHLYLLYTVTTPSVAQAGDKTWSSREPPSGCCGCSRTGRTDRSAWGRSEQLSSIPGLSVLERNTHAHKEQSCYIPQASHLHYHFMKFISVSQNQKLSQFYWFQVVTQLPASIPGPPLNLPGSWRGFMISFTYSMSIPQRTGWS